VNHVELCIERVEDICHAVYTYMPYVYVERVVKSGVIILSCLRDAVNSCELSSSVEQTGSPSVSPPAEIQCEEQVRNSYCKL